MKCPKCQYDNRGEAKFCKDCGCKLELVCPGCGNPCTPGDRFCDECGYQLSTPDTTSPKDLSFDEKLDKIQRYLPKGLTEKILSQRDRIEGERKQVTVMFCDMEGFTTLSEQIGPEEAYTIMDKVYEILIHKVHDFEGTVNEMTGDGIVALFGAPIALEDAPQRAIRSALAIHREMVKFSKQINSQELIQSIKMRIGIHTGPVVVGTVGNDLRVEFKAVGDTVNLAARIERIAEPGTTYITGDTFKLTEGLFRFEGLGDRDIKGKEKPIKVYRVLAPSTSRTRFDVSSELGLTPLLGRERELELLVDGFERAKKGRGQAFSIVAEAGLGKSRLLYEFRKAIANEDVTFLEGKCLSYSRDVAYHPVIDILKINFNIHESDSDSNIRVKVKEGLRKLEVDETTNLPYFLELLSVTNSGFDEISISPEASKTKTIESLRQIVLKGSEQRPLIMAVEDLHWVDKSSENFFQFILEDIPGARVLLVFTYRPEFVHTWGGRSYHNQVTLNRLSNRESLSMVSHLLSIQNIERNFEAVILDKTEGVPFFIEEFIRSLSDLGGIEIKEGMLCLTNKLEDVTIPSRIQDVIMARVDSLPEDAKNVLQLGSVMGREFDHDLLMNIIEFSEQELLSRLSILKDSELLYERGIYPQSTYIFKHALTQDSVYQSLLKSTRQKYHMVVALALEQKFHEIAESQPELLSYHFAAANIGEKAIPYFQRAGEVAIRRSANIEAIDHLSKGLRLLKTLPETDKRNKQELSLQFTMGPPLSAIKGASSPEVEENLIRARDLCEKTGDTRRLGTILRGLGRLHLFRSEYKISMKYYHDLLHLARHEDNSIHRLLANRGVAPVLLYLGEFTKAKSQFDQVLNLYDPEKHNPKTTLVPGSDIKVLSLSFMADILWLLGYPDKGQEKINEALALAEKISHPVSIAQSLQFACRSYALRGDMELVQKNVSKALKVATEQHFSLLAAISHWWRELSLALREGHNPRIEKVLLANDNIKKTFTGNNGFSYRVVFIAEIYLKLGQIDAALHSISEAQNHISKTGEGIWEAEAYRIKGKILMVQPVANQSEAESCFNRALEVSRHQHAKSLELRAAMSLSRLWKNQGKEEEARRLLSEIYSWFTDGFDTADLKDAKALLEELS